jgi:signal peptide peptidase-like protein 2B
MKSIDRSSRLDAHMQVKVMYWVDGVAMTALTGMSARFGKMLPDTASAAQKLPAVVPDPRTGCAKSPKAIKQL